MGSLELERVLVVEKEDAFSGESGDRFMALLVEQNFTGKSLKKPTTRNPHN